jgi:hypothetical protein
MGLPQKLDGEVYQGLRQELEGEVTMAARGCTYVVVDGVARLAIWPRGTATHWDPVRLADGTELRDGDQVRGTGSILAAKDLPGGRDANGYWAHVTGFCTGDVPEVIVLDEVRREE